MSGRFWEAQLVVFYVSGRLGEDQLVVFYVSGRFWEARLVVFFVSGRWKKHYLTYFTLFFRLGRARKSNFCRILHVWKVEKALFDMFYMVF